MHLLRKIRQGKATFVSLISLNHRLSWPSWPKSLPLEYMHSLHKTSSMEVFCICLHSNITFLTAWWGARVFLIEASFEHVLLKSVHHVSWFLVSTNYKQAVVKPSFPVKAIRSSGEAYTKLCASLPHNLSEVTRGTRKSPTIEVVVTNLKIPATTVRTEYSAFNLV